MNLDGTANAWCCLDAVGPNPKSTGNTDTRLSGLRGKCKYVLHSGIRGPVSSAVKEGLLRRDGKITLA